jgi:hypothetical protein
MRIEPFDKAKHQRAEFSCGLPALDEFLRAFVTQDEKRRLGRTFVAVPTTEDTRVVGCYALAAGAVAFAHLPPQVAKKLPEHPVPVILLERLAVDRSVVQDTFDGRLDLVFRGRTVSQPRGPMASSIPNSLARARRTTAPRLGNPWFVAY